MSKCVIACLLACVAVTTSATDFITTARNPEAVKARAVHVAKAKVPAADKTFSALQAELTAAKNQSEREAVYKKLIDKLAGVETIEKAQKDKAIKEVK